MTLKILTAWSAPALASWSQQLSSPPASPPARLGAPGPCCPARPARGLQRSLFTVSVWLCLGRHASQRETVSTGTGTFLLWPFTAFKTISIRPLLNNACSPVNPFREVTSTNPLLFSSPSENRILASESIVLEVSFTDPDIAPTEATAQAARGCCWEHAHSAGLTKGYCS